MKCPFCQSTEFKVVDKRATPLGDAIRRRRECLKCEKRFTTYERIEEVPLVVIKKSGDRCAFDRDKLRKGILRACEKRPVSVEQVEEVVSRIESKLRGKGESEISTGKIGEEVMRELKKLDKIAYIRFASVYRAFDDVEDFKDEISKL